MARFLDWDVEEAFFSNLSLLTLTYSWSRGKAFIFYNMGGVQGQIEQKLSKVTSFIKGEIALKQDFSSANTA